jgi:nucleoside-diphosphate-sugar epimerase
VGEVTNVGSTEEITIEVLAQQVKERTKSTSVIEYIPYDKAYEPGFEDMMRRVPSVDKLFALTGFRPETRLTEIIDRVALSFQAKQERAAEFQPQVKANAARQGSELLS